MKHGSLISPDEGSFGFGAHTSATVETISTHADAAEFITVPDAHLLFSGEFKHSGNDLKIVGDDGKSFVVTDYFKTDKHPTLRSPDGATLNGDLVDLLAGPLAPGQYAQAGAPQPSTAEAVGRVAVVTGNVTIIRNGVTVTVNAGDVILKNDVVQTGAGATCGLSLNDGSTFNLTGGARLAINEFVYDPNGTANASLTTLIQGAATFVAGQIAKTGDMKVATPVATMGIRGTAVILDANSVDGRVTISVVDERDNKDHNVEVFDRNGNLIATVVSNGGRLFLTPTATFEVIASFTNKTAEQIAAEFAAFQAVLSTYDAAKQWFPNLPDRADLNPKGTQHAEGSGTPPPAEKSASLPDSVAQGLKLPDVVFTKAVESPGSGDGDTGPDDGTPTIIEQTFTPPALNQIFGSGAINGTDGADYITGSGGIDTINAMGGNDFVFAFGGGDTIIAGHGGGDDYYDGGDDYDTIKFESAHGVTFNLNFNTVSNVKVSSADSTETGHDLFVNIEEIVGSPGDDVFVLHDAFGWKIDADEGFDIVKLIAGLDIYGEGGPEISNFEMVDLTNGGKNIVEFEGGGIDEHNPGGMLRIIGDANDASGKPQDIVMLTPGGANGHWEYVLGGRISDEDAFGANDHHSDGVVFDTYIFVSDEGSTIGQTIATLYVQDTISVDANDAPNAGDVTLQVNALGNGGFEATPNFDGWTVNLQTSDNTSSTVSSAAQIDRTGTIIQGDDAVAVLSFGAWVFEAGDTGYGPTITSDAFFGYEGDTVSFVWQLSSRDDWATGFGYIVDANTHEVVQVIFDYQTPFTGSTGVQTTEIALDHSGEFELVFRVGSYDWTHGQLIGAELDLGFAGILHTGVSEDLSVTFTDNDLLANSNDPDNDDLTLATVSTTSTLGAVVTLNENGSVTYDPTAAINIQSLAAGETATDTFTFTISDGNGHLDTATATLTVLGVNDSPVISIEDAHTTEDGDSTTLSGLSVLDPDAGDEFDVTIVAQHGSLSLVDDDIVDGNNLENGVSFHAILNGLNGVNDVLGQGLIYTDPEAYVPGDNDNDMVTLTVADQNGGTETLNFIFKVFGEGGAILSATAEKDVLFGTDHCDTFVFDHNVGPQGIGHDIVTDFASNDKIELVNFAYSDISEISISYNAEAQTASITLAPDETISLEQVAQPLTNDNFIFFHV